MRIALFILLLSVLTATADAGLQITFDYTYDGEGFFDDAARREALESAADMVNRFIDDLAPVVSSGSDTWSAWFRNPSTTALTVVEDLEIPANGMVVYVGATDNWGKSVMGAAGPGDRTWSGSPEWGEVVEGRGEAGWNGPMATDVAPWGGWISFNPDWPWYFGVSSEGLPVEYYDFVTVAAHELMHVVGIGRDEFGHLTPSYGSQIDGDRFTGRESILTGSPSNPDLLLAPEKTHWISGTESYVAGSRQPALMLGSLPAGKRMRPTELDRAVLRDIGWEEASPGDVDLSGNVDSVDIQRILGANSFGTGDGFGWSDGDNDGDGDVDSTDIQNILAQGAFPNDYAMAPGSDGDGTVDLLFDGAQGLSIDTDGATINGFILSSSTGVLAGSAADLSDVPGFFVTDTDEEISSQFGYAFNGVTDLGEVLAPGLSLDDLAADLTMTYTVEGQSGVFDATIVPEPMTMSLLAVGGLGVLIRRKRR
jgi:hypothetical protein